MIIQCSSCGTKFRFDESKISGAGVKLKCSKCKTVFLVKKPDEKVADEQVAPSRPSPEQEKTNICPSCCSNNPPESRFCMECGAALQKAVHVSTDSETQIKCPQCGAENASDSKFCLECGAKFAKSPASDEPTLSDKMKKMYQEQGLDSQSSDAGGTLFPFTAGWGDEYSGETVKRKGEDIKLILTLRVIKGTDKGKEYTITKKRTIIGRADADIIIDDFKTSRNHAEIEILGNKFLIKDLESTNGTFLNDNMTPADFLSHDDTITIGDTVYQVIIEEERFV
ncbi:zinc-ribbon domain-containing protein [bacterium]|nr:zinc-ribbon domain-containing protein [bacterium]